MHYITKENILVYVLTHIFWAHWMTWEYLLLSILFQIFSLFDCISLVFLFIDRTVVKCSIAKSQALYSAQRGLKTNNAAVFKVGAISINIPQHPATLHSMMVRSSHQLSKQISDLIRQPSTVWVMLFAFCNSV